MSAVQGTPSPLDLRSERGEGCASAVWLDAPRVAALALAASLAGASTGWAAEKPVVGPPPAWIVAEGAAPAPVRGTEGAAVALLSQDIQLRLDPLGQSQYTAFQAKVQSGSGLAALGTVSFAWSPATDTLTVHRLRILRGALVIDCLPKRGGFTILRREQQLDSAAQLDGVLTAVVQPEGLQVGDVLDFAYTLRREDRLQRGRIDVLEILSPAAPLARARIRASWPKAMEVRWRGLDGMPAPKVVEAGGEVSATVEAADVQPQAVPAGAPPRFRVGRQLMFSNYASWADVSALMAPLYAEAQRLAPGSPVAAQAQAIAARTADPAARASAALALVQDQVRYVAQVAGEQGLKPASVDVTWSRRLGDCKGKTVLLLALLKALGVEAEPVLAASALGDGLDVRLPALSVFDHVLVRARVGGRDYWLDGTRVGDRDLASVSTPAFGFVLPVRAAGAALLHLIPEPAKAPLGRTVIRIDASKGIDAPAPFHVEATFRGDGATALRLQLANLAPDDLERGLREFWRGQYDAVTPTKVSATFDAAAGEERLVLDGQAKLDWSDGGYEADGAALGWRFDAHRDSGPHADAPFSVAFPAYSETDETIVLPDRGRGFSIWGDNVDRELAGYAFSRRATIEDGVFHIVTRSRGLTPEIPQAKAMADAAPLTALSKTTLRIRTPADTARLAADSEALLDAQPSGRDGYLARGGARLDKGRYAEALADFDKAVGLDAGSAETVASRGLAHVWLGQSAAAKADLDRAEALDPRQVVVWRARGLLAQQDSRLADAVAAYDRALAIVPADRFALLHRGEAELQRGNDVRAMADAETFAAAYPDDPLAHTLKAAVFAQRKDFPAARREVALATAAVTPEDARREAVMQMLWRDGDREGARRAADEAVAAKPTARAYMLRAAARDTDDRAATYADVRAALALDSKSYEAAASLARMRSNDGDKAGALLYARQALAASPGAGEPLAALAQIEAQSGMAAPARAHFAEARAKAGANADLLNSVCFGQAVGNLDLPQALADCDAALALQPKTAAILDSRAFVLLRLGRDREARTAFDAALAQNPRLAPSLYGRSLVERRLGDAAPADLDLKAARGVDPKVQATFAGYGVTR